MVAPLVATRRCGCGSWMTTREYQLCMPSTAHIVLLNPSKSAQIIHALSFHARTLLCFQPYAVVLYETSASSQLPARYPSRIMLLRSFLPT